MILPKNLKFITGDEYYKNYRTQTQANNTGLWSGLASGLNGIIPVNNTTTANRTATVLQDANSKTVQTIDTANPTAALQPAATETNNKKWYYIGGGVLALIVLIVVFLKFKK